MSASDFHVTMKFGKGISGAMQGEMMLALERISIKMFGSPIEVFKETMADDSKLRNLMTDEQRAKL